MPIVSAATATEAERYSPSLELDQHFLSSRAKVEEAAPVLVVEPNTVGRSVLLGGLSIVALSRKGWANWMVSRCRMAREQDAPRPFVVFSANGQVIALNVRDAHVRTLMAQADAIDADGQWIVHASRLLTKTSLPERAATTDLFHDAAEAAMEAGLRFYFLGATQKNIVKAVETIRATYPNLTISGYRNGYFTNEQELEVCKNIVEAQTDVLWIGLGTPLQEAFVIRNRNNLAGVGWIKTCGGLFDHLQPTSKRAPMWMQKTGLEWLYRTLREPRKFFWRYASTNGFALWLLITQTRDLQSIRTDAKP